MVIFEFVDKIFEFDSSLKMKHLNHHFFSFILLMIYLLLTHIT